MTKKKPISDLNCTLGPGKTLKRPNLTLAPLSLTCAALQHHLRGEFMVFNELFF